MINWIHLTDWHVGLSAQGHLWPNLRFEFEKDLRILVDRYGGIDLVFFTGDLVQSGERKQYHELNQDLKRLWDFFASLNCSPKLVAVPGNHDLRRPDSAKSGSLALAAWHEQSEVRDVFWKGTPADVRRVVGKSFEEYERWLAEAVQYLLPFKKGLLPGDIAATFEKDDLRIGIVGLNTTFLQLRRGDFEGRLAVSARQFAEMCGDDYVVWNENHHFSVLLTHHPESWLSEDSKEEFRREIAPPGRFRLLLSGHLHKATTTVEKIAGAPGSIKHQGASLFGLEFFGEDKKAIRSHGYLFGRWDRKDNSVEERLWPRTAVDKEGGALGFVANPPSYLEEDAAIHNNFEVRSIAKVEVAEKQAAAPAPPDAKAKEANAPSLLDVALDPSEVTKKLQRALRFSHTSQPQHRAVRPDERRRLADSLRENRCAWLVADWGMGIDGFIASVIRSETPNDDEGASFGERLFQLQCDTFDQVGDLDQAFLPQFGLPLIEFLQCVSLAGPSCLVLDGIQAALTEPLQKPQLIRLLELMLDQAPTLSVILISRTPMPWRISPIEIHPLDLPDLRSYVQNHRDSQPEFTTADVLDRFFEASGGLPVHVDRILERLRVASFDAVLEEETAIIELAAVEAPLHKALQQAIAAVRKRDEENGSQGVALLRALSILTYGETIEQLKHFFPRRSFFPRDAEVLHSAALIDPIPLNLSTPIIARDGKHPPSSTVGPKILRVPKQVRDRVLATLTSEEKTEVLSAAGDFFFGSGWRIGKKAKLRKVPPQYSEYVAHGVGNEYAVLQLMIAHAKDAHDEINLKAVVRLGVHYCGILKAADRNRDLRLVALGLIRLLEGTGLDDDLCELNRLCGRASRLTGHHEEAVSHFRASLDYTRGRRKGESRTYALLEMSGSLKATGDRDGAIEAAKEVEAAAAPGSLIESQARARLVQLQDDEPDTYTTILKMKNKARAKGWISHANDLSLRLAADTKEHAKKMSLLDEVLTSEEEGWNRYRAAVEKAILAVRTDAVKTLTPRDRRDLLFAYSYCHTQRLGLFDRCHEALWQILEKEGNREGLYRLFQHSSFIWRIRGEESTELNYFERLNNLRPVSEFRERADVVPSEIQYFIKRAGILFARLLGDNRGPA
ncbi:MAG: hypothetical protein QOH88_1242 [Verrucomicrobiota bacterium]|jgi:predicted MPP superfamily phosphohydrolase